MMRAANRWAWVVAGLLLTLGCEEDRRSNHDDDDDDGGAAGAGAAASGGWGSGASAAGGSGVTGGWGSTGGSATTTGSGGEGAGGPGAACLALASCCEELGADMYSACRSVVDMGYEATCTSTLDSYHQNGYCTGSSACAALDACCPELPPGEGWQDTCNYYVDVNNAPQCEYLLGVYQQDGYCNSG